MEHEIVIVKWLDSRGVSAGWESAESIKDDKPSICHATSIGFVVYEDDEVISIAGHMADPEDPQYIGTMTIPKCSLVRVYRKVKVPECSS